MGYKKTTRMAALLLGMVMTASATVAYAEPDTTTDDAAATTSAEEYSNERLENNYTIVSKKFTAAPYTGDSVEISAEEAFDESGDGKLVTDSATEEGYDGKVIDTTIGDTVKLTVNAPETALYYLSFDYVSYDSSILPVEMSLKVNGEYPYYEARGLVFESSWQDAEEPSYDRYDNQIVAIPNKLIQWSNKYLMDGSYRWSTPLALQLEKGENELELTVLEGTLYLGNIYLNPETTIPEYTGSEKAEATGEAGPIVIQAESPYVRNDSSIRAVCEYNVNLDPYKVENKTLNALDGASFNDAGQSVTYQVDVKDEGYYYLAWNYNQPDKSDFPVFFDIAVDGEILNTAFKDYAVPYATNYGNYTFVDSDGNKLSMYLTAGVHTLTFTISADPLREVLETVDQIMNGVNDLSLDITKLAGTNKDKYRDIDVEKYIPDAKSNLLNWADQLDALYESIKEYSPKVKKIGAFANISIVTSQLRDLAKTPNDLPYRVNELCQSTSSVNQNLANMIDILNANAVSVDRIYLYQEGDSLPKKAGIFKSIASSVSRFFSSFMDQAYSSGSKDSESLQVWVNRPRQYLEIMQKMIDEGFTKETGIKVELSIMPDQNKLVLANASGSAPDIATGINYSVPFDLAIRGALVDLTEFEDFAEIAGRYTEGLLVPSTIGDGIYSLPETMNFWVLFYRTDILDKLGLEVPDTIEDVKNMLPQLQMRGLNFFYPAAGTTATKNFHMTTPLLFQYGATLYGEFAGATTINSEEGVAGFTELTDLFTIYNIPSDVPNFYQHFRNGDIPIGIADYGVYNLLTNAAPEIANSWSISVIPGIEQEDGTVSRYSSGGAESTIMFVSDEEREAKAWEFMKWWSSADVQAEFGQTLQITYGSEYIWNTANTEAFNMLPWKTEDKKVIAEQSEWINEAPRILGTYMLERELSNAFYAVVNSGDSIRETLDDAVKRIDRETERKLEEFGYNDTNGNVLIPYTVPTIDTVKEILGKGAND